MILILILTLILVLIMIMIMIMSNPAVAKKETKKKIIFNKYIDNF